LALGANAVLLGSASLYGLAAAGEAGVDHVLRLLKDEVDRTLAQIGCPSVGQLSPDYVIADGSIVHARLTAASLEAGTNATGRKRYERR
jgi:(S)-mandelate dehydrogenase